MADEKTTFVMKVDSGTAWMEVEASDLVSGGVDVGIQFPGGKAGFHMSKAEARKLIGALAECVGMAAAEE